MVGVSLDSLAQEAIFPAPTFIKIDVDGLEQEVVKGARMLLRTGKVRSVLVERDIGRPDLIQELNQEMAKHAFDLVETGMRSDRTPSVVIVSMIAEAFYRTTMTGSRPPAPRRR